MNETHCKKLNTKPMRATWNIELHTCCPACDEDFDVIKAHPDFLAEQSVIRSGITHMERFVCGHEFQIEMEF